METELCYRYVYFVFSNTRGSGDMNSNHSLRHKIRNRCVQITQSNVTNLFSLSLMIIALISVFGHNNIAVSNHTFVRVN